LYYLQLQNHEFVEIKQLDQKTNIPTLYFELNVPKSEYVSSDQGLSRYYKFVI